MKKWAIGIGLILLVLIGAVIAGYSYFCHTVNRQLEEAIAEVDQRDPGWRWEDLEESRKDIPDNRNGALQVLVAANLLPRLWPEWEFKLQFHHLRPEVQLDPRQVAALRAELDTVKPALAQARKMTDFPEGRYPVRPQRNFFFRHVPDLPHLRQTYAVGQLLYFDGLLRAQENKLDEALESCRAAANVGRSVGDEPTSISQLTRTDRFYQACQLIERILAQGQTGSPGLAALQSLLEDEDKQPLFLIMARGERAFYHRVLEAIEVGDITFEEVTERDPPRSFTGRVDTYVTRDRIKSGHAQMLKLLTKYVDIARLPDHEWGPPLDALDAEVRDTPPSPALVFFRVVPLSQVPKFIQINHARLRCAVAALAVERFRLARGRWPGKPAELVPAFLARWPDDPFDGQPLRFRRLPDGVVIYSVGPDGKDDGGNLARNNPNEPGTDLGFRFWDVDQRRQPPRPLDGEKENADK
jgi:hypothetical protein